MTPFTEDRFKEAAQRILKPWLKKYVTGASFDSFDGKKIQYYRAVRPDAKAVIVMVHGFCEFFGK